MSELKLNARVLALCELNDDDGPICTPGDIGVVVDTTDIPTVRFKRTGRASIVDMDVEVVRMRGNGFRALG